MKTNEKGFIVLDLYKIEILEKNGLEAVALRQEKVFGHYENIKESLVKVNKVAKMSLKGLGKKELRLVVKIA